MLLLLFYVASTVGALTIADRLGAPPPASAEPYAGLLIVDTGERLDLLSLGSRIEGPGSSDVLGGRVLWQVAESWTAGIDYGYARFEMQELSSGCEDAQTQCVLGITATDMHAILVEVHRHWFSDVVDFHATGGTGMLVLKADAADVRTVGGSLSTSDVAPPDFDAEREAAFLLGAGASRPLNPRVAITAEVRDLIHLCRNDPDDYKERSSWFLCEQSNTLHHWQLTTGLRVRF